MQLKFIHLAAGLVSGLGCMLSCVEINEELGKEYIPTRHLYDVYTDTIYLKDIRMKRTDKLSGYSTSRITIGSVRDEVFGLTTRGSAFTLIPVDPDMDFGKLVEELEAVYDIMPVTPKPQDLEAFGPPCVKGKLFM